MKKENCGSCEELAEIEEGEICKKCQAEFDELEAHYKPLYEGERVAGILPPSHYNFNRN